MSVHVRRAIAIAGIAALTVGAPATAFAAGHGHGHAKAKAHTSHKHHGKPAPHHFTATGTFDAADASGLTFTIDDKGGSKDLHGKTGVVITLTSKTKVTLDDASSSVDKLVAGDHVSVNGVRGADGELDAAHVNGESAPDPQSTDSPDPQSTDSPDPQSTDSPDPAPSSTDTAS